LASGVDDTWFQEWSVDEGISFSLLLVGDIVEKKGALIAFAVSTKSSG
jgi:hypothetical protein